MSAAGADRAAGEDRFEGFLPTVLFAAAAVASGVLLVVLGSRIGFSLDHWDVLLHRRGLSADVILDPTNEHPVIAPMLVWKAILGVFGMDSLTPFQLASTAAFLGSAVLLFVYVRRRVGEWAALAATLPILVLGAAADDLLLAFQIGFFGSTALGIATLLALEREDRRADLVACALLVGSLCFSSLGIPFAIGAAVRIATRPEPARRIYVVAVPWRCTRSGGSVGGTRRTARSVPRTSSTVRATWSTASPPASRRSSDWRRSAATARSTR